MARVIELIPESAALAPTRRDLNPHLRHLVRAAKAFGISESRASSIGSNVRAGINWRQERRLSAKAPLPPCREEVWRSLDGRRYKQAEVSTFIRWCSGSGID